MQHDKELVKILLDAGADADYASEKGFTPTLERAIDTAQSKKEEMIAKEKKRGRVLTATDAWEDQHVRGIFDLLVKRSGLNGTNVNTASKITRMTALQ